MNKKWLIFYFILVFIGFADSVYLTFDHYGIGNTVCSVIEGCATVLGSSYATIANIPLALIGAVYYAFLAFLGVAYFQKKRKDILRYAALIILTGIFFTAYLLFVQAFILNAFCQYCLISALTTGLLFIWALKVFKDLYTKPDKSLQHPDSHKL